MLSRVITTYVKSARDLAAALRAHRQGVADKARVLLAPVLTKGESVPDAGLLLELFARRVDGVADELEAADKAHNEELSDDAEPRRRRDEAAEDLRTVMLEVKRTLQTLFGDDALAAFKLPAEVPQDPASVRRTAADVADALETKDLPKPKIEGIKKVDAAPWLARLKRSLKRLDAASKDIAREVREAEVTLIAKNRALQTFEATFGASAAAGWGLLTAVGDKEHAARISLSPRRPSPGGVKGGGDVEPEGGEAPEPGDEEEPT
jgi:hypothetical protein